MRGWSPILLFVGQPVVVKKKKFLKFKKQRVVVKKTLFKVN